MNFSVSEFFEAVGVAATFVFAIVAIAMAFGIVRFDCTMERVDDDEEGL